MQHYFAPLEGLTDSVYRRLHHKYFGGVDSYYMPFISPTMHRILTHKEDRELPPAQSVPFAAVPQILTKNAGDFLWAAEQCRLRGYNEVNLNMGCPSGTVVSKGKGAGMLADPAALDAFLSEVFSRTDISVSVKTRLGIAAPHEFPAILEILNRYPISKLILHPRVRKQFYDGCVDSEMLAYCAQHAKMPLCCNGDLNSLADIDRVCSTYPGIDSVMLGRGLMADPGMLCGGTKVAALEEFCNALLEEYLVLFGGARNAMFRLKENWSYLLPRFEGCEKMAKQLRKTTDLAEFRAITAEIFRAFPLK